MGNELNLVRDRNDFPWSVEQNKATLTWLPATNIMDFCTH